MLPADVFFAEQRETVVTQNVRKLIHIISDYVRQDRCIRKDYKCSQIMGPVCL